MVYETHVSDITSSKTWKGSEANRYKFLGLIEENTTYTQDNTTVKTGFDHIKELGVNAVQLLPIFDQANDETSMTFNWGYNPLNYNVLEGSYSSDPYDGYARIKEFKQVVQAFNEAGINVIMDVVYNHTSGLVGSNFDVLMPGYYYRYTNDGVASNGSGCGNETASEMPMYSRFMKDSTAFLASEYKLGGYRFDLMGLHDLDTMNELVSNLKTVNENIVVYGEPWTSGTTTLSSSKQSVQANGNKYEGFGQFNDQMRDALIKGGLSSDEQVGWVTSNSAGTASDVSKIIAGVKGITQAGVSITDPDKTVNYVTCHDNYTLYDRIHAAGVSENVDKMATLANAVVLTSQGTAFILAGEEILRSKQGDKNSYESGYEINELDYSRKITYQDVFNNYKDLINFKITKDAVIKAERIREAFQKKGIKMYGSSMTNQQFPILTDEQKEKLGRNFSFEIWEKMDDKTRIVININGGTNTIMPSATSVVQYFYGEQFADSIGQRKEVVNTNETMTRQEQELYRYVHDVEKLRFYVKQIGNCNSAYELADVVKLMLEDGHVTVLQTTSDALD